MARENMFIFMSFWYKWYAEDSMIRIVFVLFVFAHGCIHFMGFAKAFGFAEMSQLTQSISRNMGAVWLVAGLLFLFAIVLLLLKSDMWWMTATLALVLSQTLVVLYWQDAKFGTIANVVVAIACVVGYGAWSFNRMAIKEVEALLPNRIEAVKVLSASDIASLPPIVQQWLKHAGVLGQGVIQTAHLYQRGEMRTTPDGSWMPVQAEQWFTTTTPGFLWLADVGTGAFVQFAGRDKYVHGHGEMLIKLFSLFPVVRANGTEIDQGSLVRYLSEIIWLPSAAASKHIVWEEVDSLRAKATITQGGTTVSGIFCFTAEGQVVSFAAPRYYSRKEGATVEQWFIALDAQSEKTLSGITIPTKASVTWKLATGDFTWYKLEVLRAEYNNMTQ